MKKFAIVSDTGQDVEDGKVISVAFKISIDGVEYIDDGTMDIDEFIERVNVSDEVVKTACPSPGEYMEAMEEAGDVDGIFVLTISGKLSGSYNAACLAKTMYLEKYPDRKCHVIDSQAASAGQSDIYLELRDLLSGDYSFDEIVEKITDYVANVRTFFVLETLDHLIKNGRMAKPAGFVVNVLNIRPIMRDNGSGSITLEELARGEKSSLNKLVEAIGKHTKRSQGKRLVISHCRAEERASYIKEKVEELYNFSEILIEKTRGLPSAYAADGGIIVGFNMFD